MTCNSLRLSVGETHFIFLRFSVGETHFIFLRLLVGETHFISLRLSIGEAHFIFLRLSIGETLFLPASVILEQTLSLYDFHAVIVLRLTCNSLQLSIREACSCHFGRDCLSPCERSSFGCALSQLLLFVKGLFYAGTLELLLYSLLFESLKLSVMTLSPFFPSSPPPPSLLSYIDFGIRFDQEQRIFDVRNHLLMFPSARKSFLSGKE